MGARHLVQGHGAARGADDEPALGIEGVGYGLQVVLVGAAAVHEHERSPRLAGRRADHVLERVDPELAHAL